MFKRAKKEQKRAKYCPGGGEICSGGGENFFAPFGRQVLFLILISFVPNF